MSLKIKICGMREAENMAEVAALRPDYMGFIYYRKSPRYVGDQFNPEWATEMKGIRKTAVFVNEPLESALGIIERLGFDAVQLHGDETPGYCRQVKQAGLEVIKAFGIGPGFDFSQLDAYGDAVDFFLFDAKTQSYGGSGKRFSWEQLGGYTGGKAFFLSGGLDPENLREAIASAANLPLYALDLNSRIELAPALKDTEKAAQAIRLIKQREHEDRK